jgi:hypothetical protein
MLPCAKPVCRIAETLRKQIGKKRPIAGGRSLPGIAPTISREGGKMPNTHSGTCFCGAVEVTVSGEPAGMGYCHCSSCRSWSAAPVNAFTLWPPDAVKITKGADKVGTYNKTPYSFRKWCTVCGGHIMTDHPTFGLVDVYAATIPTLPFKPGVHVNYQETVLPMKDGLPKLRDFPKELGGSGEAIPE